MVLPYNGILQTSLLMLGIGGFTILVFCCYKLHRNINVQNHLYAVLIITRGYILRSRIALLVILISLTQGSFFFFFFFFFQVNKCSIFFPLAFLQEQTFISCIHWNFLTEQNHLGTGWEEGRDDSVSEMSRWKVQTFVSVGLAQGAGNPEWGFVE